MRCAPSSTRPLASTLGIPRCFALTSLPHYRVQQHAPDLSSTVVTSWTGDFAAGRRAERAGRWPGWKVANSLKDLSALPGDRFEPLKGDGKDHQRSMENRRICFAWPDEAQARQTSVGRCSNNPDAEAGPEWKPHHHQSLRHGSLSAKGKRLGLGGSAPKQEKANNGGGFLLRCSLCRQIGRAQPLIRLASSICLIETRREASSSTTHLT